MVAGLVTGCANSDNNLFGQEELSSGYMNQADSAKEGAVTKVKDGACGEGKCGGKMMSDVEKVKEGTCGDKKMGMDKTPEGTCGDKKMATDVEKAVEGKCGENK